MPPQLKVLIPLFAAFVIIFLIIRHFIVPASFYEKGHYRANALIDIANREVVYSNKETCIDCHPDMYEKLQSDKHAHLNCLVCHGPGLEHANSPDSANIVKKSGREHCGRCHSINPARAEGAITQIDIKTHHIEKDNCIECHNPHQVWEIKE
jgi:NAD-dependent dihydropyrimidine dehydrogenase PreA subunit